MRGKLALMMIAGVILLALVGWWQRTPLLARWHVHQLSMADDQNRDACAEALAPLAEAAIAPLLEGLTSDDESVCRNLETGVRAVTTVWTADDPRLLDAFERILGQFSRMSQHGQKAALRVAASLVNRPNDETLPGNLARVLGDLMTIGEANDSLRPEAFGLAGTLVERSPAGQWQAVCRSLAIKGMADVNPATRLASLQLLMRTSFRGDVELLTRAVPFLRDRDPQLRRSALLVLGANRDVAREDVLLPLLHDDDLDIRRVCEITLRSRGLSDEHIQLARLISDPDPSVRLQVIPRLRGAIDLDADAWLRRLTLDSAPAVRAAAIRVASVDPSDDIRQRLGEMAQTDPSPTVREIARFYVDRTSVRKVGR